MKDYERRVVDVFLYSLTLLKTEDDGLAPGNDEADLNAVGMMCGMVKWIACAGTTPEHVLLYGLAHLTEYLLTTAVMAAEFDVVTDWLKTRAELVSCRLGGLR